MSSNSVNGDFYRERESYSVKKAPRGESNMDSPSKRKAIISSLKKEWKEFKLEKQYLQERIKTSKDKVQQKVHEKLKNSKQKIEVEYDKIKLKSESHSFIKMVDKLQYTIFLTSFTVLFTLMFFPRSSYLVYWVFLLSASTIGIRFYRYRVKKWHYFLWDFCYFLNFLMYAFVLFYPKSKFVFLMMFLNACGPILDYFFFFRSRISFDDIEGMTNYYMHITPSFVSGVLRHYSTDTAFISSLDLEKGLMENGVMELWTVFKTGFFFYILWLVTYYVMVFVVLNDRIQRKGRETLYTFTSNHFLMKLVLKNQKRKNPIQAYFFLHLLTSLVGHFFALLQYYSPVFQIIWVSIASLIPILYSSAYYIDYFSEKYTQNVLNKVEGYQKYRGELSKVQNQANTDHGLQDHTKQD